MILEFPPLGKPWSNKLEFLLNFVVSNEKIKISLDKNNLIIVI